jgi:hypothetical protein
MLKDPRLCITLRTWLLLLTSIPAILFTYRHPLDVALSLHKREFEKFEIVRGLKLWYIYNKRAIEQSNDLCRVIASHQLVMSQPKIQLDRIYNELRESCGVAIPHALTETDIGEFIDNRLQHGKSGVHDDCSQSIESIVPPPSSWENPTPPQLIVYREVMRVFCAMESGEAFLHTFHWDKNMKDG